MAELLLSALNSLTGWTASSGLTLELQEWPEYIASNHAAAVAVRIPAGSSGKSVTLTLPAAVDVSTFSELIVSLASLRQQSGPVKLPTDARYSITVATGQAFYVPTWKDLAAVAIPVDGFTQVTQLKITVLHDDSDYLIMSDFRAVWDGLPADILNAVKSGIEIQRDRILSLGREIGTVTADTGDRQVIVESNWEFLDENVVMLIGGSSGERHQIANWNGTRASFKDNYDGRAILAPRVAASVHVTFPVEVGYYDRDAKLPGIALWYASPTPATRQSRAEVHPECVGPLGSYLKRDGLLQTWRIQLEVVARSPELQQDAARAARAFLATSVLWVHGRRVGFEWSDPAVDAEPVEAFDIVPRASYVFDVEVREDAWQRLRTNRASPTLAVSPVMP